MRRINITHICLGDYQDVKPFVFKKMLSHYYDNDYIMKNLESNEQTNKYWFFKYNEDLHVNLIDSNIKTFDKTFEILSQCNGCIFSINCNKYKISDIDTELYSYFYACYTLGIKNIILLIHNLENFPNNDAKNIYNTINKYFKKKLDKIGLTCGCIPFSVLEDMEHTQWFNDYNILDALNKFTINDTSNLEKSLIINNTFRYNKNYSVINGIINSGIIKNLDVLCIKPQNIVVNVKKIEKNHNEINEAYPGDYVGLLIDSKNISDNNLAVGFNSNIKKTSRLICRIVVVCDVINLNDKLTMYYNQTKVKCKIDTIHKNTRLIVSNINDLPNSITKTKMGVIDISLEHEIYTNPFCPDTKDGRLLFKNEENKLACIGIIKIIK